jgi:hypothetical protein
VDKVLMVQLQLVQLFHVIHKLCLLLADLGRHVGDVCVGDFCQGHLLSHVQVVEISCADAVQVVLDPLSFDFELLVLYRKLSDFLPPLLLQ